MVIILWVVFTCAPVFFLLKHRGHLRVERLIEAEGIDSQMQMGRSNDDDENSGARDSAKRRALADLLLDGKRRAMLM